MVQGQRKKVSLLEITTQGMLLSSQSSRKNLQSLKNKHCAITEEEQNQHAGIMAWLTDCKTCQETLHQIPDLFDNWPARTRCLIFFFYARADGFKPGHKESKFSKTESKICTDNSCPHAQSNT